MEHQVLLVERVRTTLKKEDITFRYRLEDSALYGADDLELLHVHVSLSPSPAAIGSFPSAEPAGPTEASCSQVKQVRHQKLTSRFSFTNKYSGLLNVSCMQYCFTSRRIRALSED